MKRFLTILFTIIISLSFLAGCSAKKADKELKSVAPAQDAKGNYGSSSQSKSDGTSVVTTAKDQSSGQNGAAAVGGNVTQGSTVQNPILAQRKVIRNANMSVEVEDFDKAYGQVKSMLSAFGFIQETNIKKEKVYVNSEAKFITRGTIIIRVDKDKFDGILNDVKGIGVITDESIKSDDITDKYFDTESLLRLKKFEQDRLEKYLLKVDDPKVIFETEKRLTEIRQDIESLTGNLNKWNNLVELSTITLNISEKRPEALVEKESSYWWKLWSEFKSSVKGVISFCGAIIIFIVKSIPVIILLGIFGFAALWVYKKINKLKASNIINKKLDE